MDQLAVAQREILRATVSQVLSGTVIKDVSGDAQAANELMAFGRFLFQRVRDSQRVDKQTLARRSTSSARQRG